MQEKYINHLSNESSLYLQQHAHNPVDWYPWSDGAWEKAKKENKLVLVSIGYSSCHWCHVMEHETFTDETAARIMNERFVCIKVDREERPDIDMIYMNAVQLMTGGGGWPLNCFTLPDGRPIYGGTYYPKATWMEVLVKLDEFYKNDPVRAAQYAAELLDGMNHSELFGINASEKKFDSSVLDSAIQNWKPQMDNVEGGPARVPKFPLPGNYQFLLRFAFQRGDDQLLDHVKLTLKKLSYGGIYDQLAGGFARYSTDALWKVPHFEKMLYDNAQLVSLYSNAYRLTRVELFKKTAIETIHFLKENMSDGNGGYYSAFDADSEGEEGKYYVWTIDEIKKINLPDCGSVKGFDVLSEYYNLNNAGYWEKNNYILLRNNTDEEIAAKFKISVSELALFIDKVKGILLAERNKRIPPALDKKIITSWNALQVTALCNAYMAFGKEEYKNEALLCANQILKNGTNSQDLLKHICSAKNQNPGYLEDYAFTITALTNLYSITFDEQWIFQAKNLAEDAIENFYDEDGGFFWFNSKKDAALIARKKEITDNVIPSSNSEMANALFILGKYFDDKNYTDISLRMLISVKEGVESYPSSYSNWANLAMNESFLFHEIIITGINSEELRKNLSANYLSNVIFAGLSKDSSKLSLLKNRFVKNKSLIYVCTNKTCKLPVESIEEVFSILKDANK
jgi:uncharacterized protein YyaL (SSP411 family)